ncbi:hypothetical protein G7Y89_g15744 [Cudoniella acicularis]|uniref:Glycosyltransferase 2 n=1 Tax=Cudoniella acicularis TaxID=354080 RepID=A0A8H4QG60_9HELO|nr:hypothetical protein G7Y89_g15744 [Cudoniella acicularis]
MPLPPRLFAGDVELGKRDDDHKPGTKSPLGLAWQQRRIPHGPHRRTLKRLFLGMLAMVAIWHFIKNMPTDLKQPRPRPHYIPPSSGPVPQNELKKEPPSRAALAKQGNEGNGEASLKRTFNGPIKFYKLAASLHAVQNTRGSELMNRNVLFAAASLKSAATLLPIACEMALRERSFVHFVLMGRDEISMDILKSVNGITKECKIIFHDARPDFSTESSEFRMEISTSAGFNHVNNFVHPQATLIDGSGEEEPFFLKGLKTRATGLGRTVIELPANTEQHMMWITLLDSASLSAWHKASMDIVIHAQPSASGSLMRLLDSLKKADFFSSAPPRLTIELPNQIDEPTRQYLGRFKWPPNAGDSSGSLLTLHHRIPQNGLTPEENSIRFLEAFWPADPFSSHVLVLSPQTELSPLFFHYLKYVLLEYRHSIAKTGMYRNFLGISLDMPSTYLNDSTTFAPPTGNNSNVTPFLWQAPNSNAALYFGEKWVELHDFVANLLSSQHKLPTPTTLNEKLVSKTYPSWLEHVLKLMRVRGYWMLYPGLEKTDSLANLHNELYQPPEEYKEDIKVETHSESGELTADPARHLSLKHDEAPLITKPLLTILPSRGDLPRVIKMPFLKWDGELISLDDVGEYAANYSSIFRHEIGGCDVSLPAKPVIELSAQDLFCLNDEKVEKDEVQPVNDDVPPKDEHPVRTEGES